MWKAPDAVRSARGATGLVLVLATALLACKMTPEKACKKAQKLEESDGKTMSAKELATCEEMMTKLKEDHPETWDCMSSCVKKSDTREELNTCSKGCDMSKVALDDDESSSGSTSSGGVPMSLEECKDMSLWVVKKRKEAGLISSADEAKEQALELFDDCAKAPGNGKWRCLRLSTSASSMDRCD